MEKINKTVVLKYEEQNDIAPKIVAKGKGSIGKKILEIAEKNNIPVYKDDTLVDILDRMDVGTVIPEELYLVIAELFAFLYKVKRGLNERYE